MRRREFFMLLIGYCVASLLLFLYSYTQIDLNLTISKISFWQHVQKIFQSIGYFHRTASTGIFLILLTTFYILYIRTILAVKNFFLSVKQVWILIAVVIVFVTFSYPAFSYDIYNYMFTAKTVVFYRQNPYVVLPLQYAGIDPWVNIMRWTHLPSAYTPLWILITLPVYILGMGYFLPTLWIMKLLMALLYIATAWLIYKILMIVDSKNSISGLVLFALNPLIIFETLVSGHNDISMMVLAMLAFYAYIKGNQLKSIVFLSFSIAFKLITIFLLPIYFFKWNRLIAVWFMVIGLMLVMTTRDILPWYYVWIIPFMALVPRSRNVNVLVIGTSVGLLLRYVPYIYFGSWDPPALFVENSLSIVSLLFSVMYVAYLSIKENTVLRSKVI